MGEFLIVMGIILLVVSIIRMVKEDKVVNEKLRQQTQTPEYQERQRKIAELNAKNVAYCPWCLSESVQLVSNEKSSAGKAVVGTIVAGIPGTIIGASMKDKKIQKICLKCGRKWN